MRITIPLVLVSTVLGDLAAQSNTVAGLNGRLFDISSPTVWGRHGAAYPGGAFGFSVQNDMCNPGSVVIPWSAAMAENHPKFGFIVARESGTRMVQISDRSFAKHAFLSLNSNSGPCLPCTNPGTGSVMGVGCADAYANSNNGDRTWLGPADEIDPWLGTWNHIGSYFDRGDPDVGPPSNADGLRSLTGTQISAFDSVKNRVTITEHEATVVGTYYFQIHLVHQGEAVGNRGDNIMNRGVSFTFNGTSWSTGVVGSAVSGSVLTRWTGATNSTAGNGTSDGRFLVAVKVTGPTGGLYHYEYAVHNIDNSRGGASLRIPVCPSARVLNPGFRDIDTNSLNDWLFSRSSSEIAFTAPATNPQNWNTLFNFWFDSDAAPVASSVSIDEARIGAGALSVSVASRTPGLSTTTYLGDGCGSPAASLFGNGVPSAGNLGYALQVQTAPSTGLFAFYSFGTASLPIGTGCTQYLDSATIGSQGFLVANGAGLATIPLPIPVGQLPLDLSWQVAQLIPGGPVFSSFGVSNGLTVHVAATGCQ